MILDLLWGLCTVCLLQILYLLVNLAMEHQYFSWHGLPGQRGTKAPRRCYGLLGWSYWGSWQSFIMKIATKTIFFYWFFFFNMIFEDFLLLVIFSDLSSWQQKILESHRISSRRNDPKLDEEKGIFQQLSVYWRVNLQCQPQVCMNLGC